MPADDGKLTEEEREQVKNWLRERGAIAACPICRHPEWAIAEHLALHQQFNPNGGLLLGAGIPSVVVICTKCTFIRFHSAIVIGVGKAKTDVGPKEEAKRG